MTLNCFPVQDTRPLFYTQVSILSRGLLHTALEDAVKWDLLARNVCDRVSLPSVTKSKIQALTLEQVRKLLEHLDGDRLEMLITMALTTGMRRGELLALRWTDVEFELRTIQVQRTVDYIPTYGYVENDPKTEAGRRTVILPMFVVQRLKHYKSLQLEQRLKAGSAWENPDLVFTDMRGGYFNPRYLEKTFALAIKQAGIPHMRFHDLRHSAATLLLSMGVEMKVIQEILGHSHFSMTADLYSHVLLSMQEDAMDRWDKQMGL